MNTNRSPSLVCLEQQTNIVAAAAGDWMGGVVTRAAVVVRMRKMRWRSFSKIYTIGARVKKVEEGSRKGNHG